MENIYGGDTWKTLTQAGWQTRERLGGAVAEEYKQESLRQQSRIFQCTQYSFNHVPCFVTYLLVFQYIPFFHSVKLTDSKSEELIGSVLFVNLNIKKVPEAGLHIYIPKITNTNI